MNAIRLSTPSWSLAAIVPLALVIAGCESPAPGDNAAAGPLATSESKAPLLRSGPITWRLLDNASFDEGSEGTADQQRLHATLAARAGDPTVDRPGAAAFSGTVRVDRAGHRWIVDSVDWDALNAKRNAALAASAEADQPPPVPGSENTDDGDDDGGYDVPLSWTGGTCSSGSIIWATWNGDDRVSISAPTLTDRQKTVVTIVSGTGNKGCTGVLVDNQWVLTAAHCVTGPTGAAHNPVNTTVTVGGNSLYDNFEQVGVVDIVLDGAPWNGNVKTDYALLELDTNVGDTNKFMSLSVATDATVTGNPLHNLAFPPHKAPVSSCIGTSLMTHLIENAKSVSTKLVKTYFDVESGHSGSPIYYCPTGADDYCDTGDNAYVITVVSSIHYNIFGDPVDVRGPRVKNFQPWASGLLPNQ